MSTMTVKDGVVLQTAEQQRLAILLDPIRAALKFAVSDLSSTADSILALSLSDEQHEQAQEWLNDSERFLEQALEAVDEVVEDARYGVDYDGVLEGVERLRESIQWGLHDEPRTVIECGERIEDVLRKADYF